MISYLKTIIEVVWVTVYQIHFSHFSLKGGIFSEFPVVPKTAQRQPEPKPSDTSE